MAGKRISSLLLVFCAVLSASFAMPKAALGYTAPHVPDPTIEISPLIEGLGGTFSIHYDHTYPVYDYMFVVSNAANTFSFMRYGFGPNQVIPDPIYWNGHTLDQPNPPSWSTFPAGDYNLNLSITYWTGTDVAVSQVRQVIHVRPAANVRPVLFIHGLSSYPDMWQDASHHNDYFALLESAGYPKEFLDSYHYSGVGVGENGYNNQGDIVEMAMGMDAAVNRLSRVSREYGGDGTVDIVCHSMGGLIARQYLLTHPANHHIGKIISIGTPYQGSWLMSVDSLLGNPVKGETNDPMQVKMNNTLAKAITGLGFPLNPNYMAEQEMTPGSSFLSSISDVQNNPNVKYYTVYGDITVKVKQTLFSFDLYSKTVSKGDLIVLPDSSTNVSATQSTIKQRFSETNSLILNTNVVAKNLGFNIEYSLPDINALHYWHVALPNQSDVQATVLKDLNDAQ